MAQNFVNSYSPLTPIGAAMQNISAAMFGGRTPNQQAADEARIANYLSSAEQSRAAADRADSERRINEDILARRSQDAMDQAVSYRSGMPLPRVRAIRAYLSGEADLPGDVTPADVSNVGQIYFSHGGGLADRTYSPEGVEKGISTGRTTTAWADALTDPSKVQPLARAQNAREGRGELAASTGINTFTGNADNPFAQAVIKLRNGQTNQANAAAFASNQLGQNRQFERNSGVSLGAPVIAINPDTGQEEYTSPAVAAMGRRPGAKPKPDAAPKPVARKPMTRDQTGTLSAAIDSLTGQKPENVDPQTRAQIVSRATQLVTDTESEFYQDPAGAAEAVVREIAPQGFSREWGMTGRGPAKPKGGAQPAQKQPGAAAPTAGVERKTINGKNYVKQNGQWFEE